MDLIWNQKIKTSDLIILIVHIFISIGAFSILILSKNEIDTKETLYQFTIVGCIAFTWNLFSWYFITREIINIYLIFIIFSFIFFLGQPISMMMNENFNSYGILTIESLPHDSVNYALIFIIQSILLIQLGAIISGIRKKKVKLSTKSSVDYSRSMIIVGYILLMISVVPVAIILINNFRAIATGGYAAIFLASHNTSAGLGGGYIRILANLFIPAILLLIIGESEKRKRQFFWVAVALLYIGLFFLVGIRGSTSLFLFAIILVFHFTVKRFSKKKVFILALSGFAFIIIMKFISIIRAVVRGNMGIWNIISDTWHSFIVGGPFFSALSEFGTTLVAISLVFEHSPSTFPFNNGLSYYNSLLAVLPNLFWDVHPAAAAGTMDEKFSPLLTIYGGLGGSFVSEVYYNFGHYGLWVMPLIGYMLGKLYYKLSTASYWKNKLMIFIYIYISHFILWYIRSETMEFWRNLIYYALIPALMVYIVKNSGKAPSNFKAALDRGRSSSGK